MKKLYQKIKPIACFGLAGLITSLSGCSYYYHFINEQLEKEMMKDFTNEEKEMMKKMSNKIIPISATRMANPSKYEQKYGLHTLYRLNEIWYEDTNDSLNPWTRINGELKPNQKYNSEESVRILQGNALIDPEDRVLTKEEIKYFLKRFQVH